MLLANVTPNKFNLKILNKIPRVSKMESLFYKTEERCSSHNGQNVHQLVNGFLKTVVHPNNELLGNKKEWTTDTHTNMNQPQKHYANWKMPDTVIHSLTPLYEKVKL